MQPRRGAGLRSGVRVDREAGDPLALGKREACGLVVDHGFMVALVGPVLQLPAAVILVPGLAEDGEAVGADHGRLVAGVAGALASWVDQVQGSVSSQRKCRTVLPEFVPPKRHWARLPRVWYCQSLPAFVILPPGLRTEKPCVISELFETMVAGSFMTSAEMVALLVTVSEVVTAPRGTSR